jgi:hypothetical protein
MKLKRASRKSPVAPRIQLSSSQAGRSTPGRYGEAASCARGIQERTLDPANQPFAVYVKSNRFNGVGLLFYLAVRYEICKSDRSAVVETGQCTIPTSCSLTSALGILRARDASHNGWRAVGDHARAKRAPGGSCAGFATVIGRWPVESVSRRGRVKQWHECRRSIRKSTRLVPAAYGQEACFQPSEAPKWCWCWASSQEVT